MCKTIPQCIHIEVYYGISSTGTNYTIYNDNYDSIVYNTKYDETTNYLSYFDYYPDGTAKIYYLQPSWKIKSGTGTQIDPFIIEKVN